MEIWAYCDPCVRWFYCPTWFDSEAPAPTCPICSSEPRAIENRAVDGHRVGIGAERYDRVPAAS
jgi:hypothetical protein